MIFNDHSYQHLDAHAFLSPSQYHWINYDEEKIATTYRNSMKKEMGTRLHALAAEHIELGIKMPRTKQTLNMFINDAIGFRMSPEVILYYSDRFFGTADAICFNEETNMLRIHDYKSGDTPAHMEQLRIYAALFCLEYKYKPDKIKTELRIYQFGERFIEEPDPEEISRIMEIGTRFDKILAYEEDNIL